MRRYLYRRLAHSIRQPEPKKMWAVRRNRDGAWWAGPYRWRGETFTPLPRRAYVWGSQPAAMSAVQWGGWQGVTVVEVDPVVFSRRRRR
jgi:hypothetical protein